MPQRGPDFRMAENNWSWAFGLATAFTRIIDADADLTPKWASGVRASSGLAFIPFPASAVYCATKAAIHSFTLSLRIQMEGTGVTVVELAPPAVETPLLRGEFAEEMKEQKGMDVKVLARHAISGIEAGKLEIRPASPTC
jgi:uncharacterized oxidoreductase